MWARELPSIRPGQRRKHGRRHAASRTCRAMARFSAAVLAVCPCLSSWDSNAQPAPPTAKFEVAETIYDGGLRQGWQDWGWGAHDLSSGPARITMTNYGGWILRHEELQTRYGALVFRILSPSGFGEFLQVHLANGEKDQSMPLFGVALARAKSLGAGWLEVYVPWADLNPRAQPFDRIIFNARTPVGSEPVLFDKIELTLFDPKAAPAAPVATKTKRVALQVDCRAPVHAISPNIYGVAGEVSDTGAAGRRWGGNPMTRYNWRHGTAYNVGKDWYFENGATRHYREYLADNQAKGLTTALTVPMIGWVAKDTDSVGFPVSAYGPQRAHDPYRPNAGDGVRADGAEIEPGPPTMTSVEASPEMIGAWVQAIREEDRKAKRRSVELYYLDNEPSLWNTTHRDVRPAPLGYDELLDRTIRYGRAIREADPDARIAGPSEWGWTGYFYSAKDVAAGVNHRPDRRVHGDAPLIPWYLRQLKEYERKNGERVLDVLDVHFYPQGEGVYSSKADPATAALRLRSTRALWDPNYTDESWISEPVRLLPRLKEWVQENYPGLGISIGEYSFGGEQHMSGALAQAEALGRFGAAGIDYAFYWFQPPVNSPVYWAFRAFRNFDGNQGAFQERSVQTRMTDDVSLFASSDASGNHMVLIALNMNPTTSARTSIAMENCGSIVTRRKFVYSEAAPEIVDEGAEDADQLEDVLAPYSINIFDVKLR